MRKRRIFGGIILVWNLLFGSMKLSSSRSKSSQFEKQTAQKIVKNCSNSFEDNGRQVILAKAEGSSVNPPTIRGPSNFLISPSGGRTDTNFSRQCYGRREAYPREIVYKIKENRALVNEAETMGKDQAAQKDVNHLIEQLSLGNLEPGLGTERLKALKNVSEARGKNEGRVYFREKDGKIEILAKSNKDNQKKVIGILERMDY